MTEHLPECPVESVVCEGEFCHCDYAHFCNCNELRACEERVGVGPREIASWLEWRGWTLSSSLGSIAERWSKSESSVIIPLQPSSPDFQLRWTEMLTSLGRLFSLDPDGLLLAVGREQHRHRCSVCYWCYSDGVREALDAAREAVKHLQHSDDCYYAEGVLCHCEIKRVITAIDALKERR